MNDRVAEQIAVAFALFGILSFTLWVISYGSGIAPQLVSW